MSNRPAVIFAAASLFLSTTPAFAQASGDGTASNPSAPSTTTTEQKSTKPPTETGARPSSTQRERGPHRSPQLLRRRLDPLRLTLARVLFHCPVTILQA